MRRKDDLAVKVTACLVAIFLMMASAAGKTGEFKGEPVVKFLSGSRHMQLVAPFTYIDSHGTTWSVPAGTRIDGASIPRVFWSIIGAPYTGRYREASIIHDYFCATKSRHWKAVHKVFLDGMLTQGVGKMQAELMYLAVYRFGPRWDFDVDACYCEGCPTCASPIKKRVKSYKPTYDAKQFEELRQMLAEGKSTLGDLEDAADYQLNTEILKQR